eukprot:TRINITY_DN777918_c0_g1_i1.p1 TRINITY_DN777918_c0_g1~~TRINITY_DN777918_c0_g1_i1.p1  ORF type:complete len:322 (+),score=52.53 TRINITY_DN777918_c0_g1_i1:27-968(+)
MSFTRRAGATKRLKGTKAWTNGQTLVSSGLASLDKRIIGGYPLGSLTLIINDNYTTFSKSIMQYSIAEALESGHCVLACGNDEYKLAELKRNVPSIVAEKKSKEEPEKKQKAAPNLKIAWQYKQYLTAGRSLSGGGMRKVEPFCHTFDLSSQRKETENMKTICSDSLDDIICGIEEHLSTTKDKVTRVFVSDYYFADVSEKEIMRFVISLRSLIQKYCSHTLAMICLDECEISSKAVLRTMHISDLCLKVESFAEMDSVPIEFRSYVGFLHVKKARFMKHLNNSVSEHILAIKRTNTKMQITQLNLPPEESRV